jgi:hypothetical protein
MSKLGYTWYPKDWGTSEKVFELTLIERGLYRELIDMAMLNDNKTQINAKVWARKFGSTEDEVEGILITLTELGLVQINNDYLFIPSCESRLNLSRGGKKSKPLKTTILNLKNQKPIEPISEPIPEPISEQIEKKEKEKEIENKIEVLKEEFKNSPTSEVMKKNLCSLHHMTEQQLIFRMKNFWLENSHAFNDEKTIQDVRSHFSKWLKIDLTKNPIHRINQ